MTISLLFGVHAHQPVGNFPAVIDDAHVRSYGMFLRVMERYPEFRFSVHFSGWLLDVLFERFPDDMARLAAMTRRGQVEWFGSGDCEPVLAAIPHCDRVTQIATLSDKIERCFGMRPAGAWLTERVWESSVVPALVETGIRYVAVDDYHFLCAGEDGARLDSFYTTEEDGRCLDLFPISEAARYRLPFSPAAEAVAWLEALASQGHRASIYFDDIEKFGIWPETYEWVFEKGWLTQFVEGVLASPLIRTDTFADFHAREKTRGIVYLPTTSYIEMNEWTLPAPRAAAYHALVDTEKAAGRFELHKPFLRGGIWRNFMSRYPEANWMHKRMLGASQRLAALPAPQRSAAMQEHLHRAQANDAYWHGLFGGLYLPHLRRAVWNNLLALEATLATVAPAPTFESVDLDHDGHLETVLRNGHLQAFVRDDGDATLVELSSLVLAHNFGDTLRAYGEAYHAKIDQAQTAHAEHGAGIASAHDRVAFLHTIVPGDATPDLRPRGIFLDRLCSADGPLRALDDYRAGNREGTWIAGGEGWRLEKSYRLEADSLSVIFRTEGDAFPALIETELNLALPSCDGYGGRYVLASGDIPGGFGQPLELDEMLQLTLDDSELRGALRIETGLPVRLKAQPHRTVSQSEAGFEKIMQAVCIALAWSPLAGSEQRITLRVIPAT
ncbi:MAG: glycosyl hydrolase [Rhodocyclales bacterium GWA2_65_19]|nr:MAG: glycosyl hydrolase [Rhodocyclales bacterium GWA2_65_19]